MVKIRSWGVVWEESGLCPACGRGSIRVGGLGRYLFRFLQKS